MKFNYIKYYNYRCFKDMTVNFETTKEKNISLVLGVNGSGKTEMLFSFQWVLYGFDFKSLREKEETPYSLNSRLYHELVINPHANSVDCWVELSFTHKDRTYFVKRIETFMRLQDKVNSFMKVEMSLTEPNGERSIPEKDKEIIEQKLSRIIPKAILEGITFDGERMKKLNFVGEQSVETIKNVISLVTNERLFDLCNTEIKDVTSDLRKEKIRINKRSGNVSAKELEEEIVDLEQTIEDKEIELQGIEKNIEKVQAKLDDISTQLSNLEESRKLEEKRKGLERDLITAKRHLNNGIDGFYKRLGDGYLLVADNLVQDVKLSLENVDVPMGLTVEAVKNILKRPNCICGCEMNSDAKKRLTELIATLPPDNISSTLLYMANQFDSEKRRARDLLLEAYKTMKDAEKEVTNLKKQLADISTSLLTNVSGTIKELEGERAKYNQKLGALLLDKERCIRAINAAKKRLKEAKIELEQAKNNQGELRNLSERLNVLDLFKEAIKKIGVRNGELSLISINEYLSEAYSKLSEDSGRCLYLCQFNKDKYRLVTYVKSKYAQVRSRWINSGQLKTYEDEGWSESQIKENIILNVAEGKSTGQSKINSLAFAKAVLDYSNEDRASDTLKVSHDYPFFIDSPFTELSGKNLTNVAQYIHTFANQIILMADDESYNLVKDFVEPSVKSKSKLLKNDTEGITSIKN